MLHKVLNPRQNGFRISSSPTRAFVDTTQRGRRHLGDPNKKPLNSLPGAGQKREFRKRIVAQQKALWRKHILNGTQTQAKWNSKVE